MAESKGAESLATKIASISGEIDKIAKTGTNREQKYKFIEYATVAGKIRELCAKYRIAIIPEVSSYDVAEVVSKYGAKGFHYLTHMKFLIINGDKPEEREERTWVSEATDYGDKGINKSITAGEKYFLMRLFHISEKDSEDADKTTPEQAQEIRGQSASKPWAKPSEKQLDYLKTLLKKLNKTDEEIAEIMTKMTDSKKTSEAIDHAQNLLQGAA